MPDLPGARDRTGLRPDAAGRFSPRRRDRPACGRPAARGDSRAPTDTWFRRHRATAFVPAHPAARSIPRRRRFGVGADMRQAGRRIARTLDVARSRDACGDLGRAFGRRRQDQIGRGHRRHLDAQVDAVHQGTGNPHLVVGGAAVDLTALAGIVGLEGAAAAAWIHGHDQHETRRVSHAMIGTGDRDRAYWRRSRPAVHPPQVRLSRRARVRRAR